MAWTDYGSEPAGINDITRQNFYYPSKVAAVFQVIGCAIGGLIFGIMIGVCLTFVVCVFSCGTLSSEADQFLTATFAILGIGGLIAGAIARWLEYKQTCERIDSELRLVANYHLYYCKKGFYETVVRGILNKLDVNNSLNTIESIARSGNLYNEIASFVSKYMHDAGRYRQSQPENSYSSSFFNSIINSTSPYINRCPDILAEDLRQELHRYVDFNSDEIIAMANRCLSDNIINGGLKKGIAILRVVEGNSNVDSIISNLIKGTPGVNREYMIKSDSINEQLLTTLMSYDEKITEDLFNSEYQNFEKINTTRTPYNIISMLSVDSYWLFLWYFSIRGNKDLYNKTLKMISYFFDTSLDKEISTSGIVCDQCNRLAKQNREQLNDINKIKTAIGRSII